VFVKLNSSILFNDLSDVGNLKAANPYWFKACMRYYGGSDP
jgi:hypothetical protein